MADRFPGGVISKTPPVVSRGGPDVGSNLYAWGAGGFGQLGITGSSSTASGVWTLSEVLGHQKSGQWPGATFNPTANQSSPVSVGSDTNWAQVSGSTAAIRTDGSLWAWGSNGFGRLGDGTVVARSSPVQIGALTNWAQVSVGGAHVASVKTDGTLWAWGRNLTGRLGDNTVVDKSSPVQIGALTNWAQVSAGVNFTAAVKTAGTLWSWGDNNTGQLGHNDRFDRSSPVQVGALTNWAQVSAAGTNFTAAITTSGALYAWGYNANGRLGDGTTINRSSPVQVGALTNWAQVSAGQGHALAVKTDGTLWAWGRGTGGQLGNDASGFNNNRSSPIQIGALTNWAQVSANTNNTAAVKTDGTLWTWGTNTFGQIGDGTQTSRSSPVQVGALTNWAQVSSGGNSTFAIETG